MIAMAIRRIMTFWYDWALFVMHNARPCAGFPDMDPRPRLTPICTGIADGYTFKLTAPKQNVSLLTSLHDMINTY